MLVKLLLSLIKMPTEFKVKEPKQKEKETKVKTIAEPVLIATGNTVKETKIGE